jgi:hypothetical protein
LRESAPSPNIESGAVPTVLSDLEYLIIRGPRESPPRTPPHARHLFGETRHRRCKCLGQQ